MSRGRLLAGVGFVAATAAVAAVVAMPAQAQEGKILMAGTANAVDGHYIVTLKDTNGFSAKAVTTQADSLSIKYGAKVGYKYTAALHGFSVTATEAQAKQLAADPGVASVQVSHKFSVSDTQANPPSWGLDRVDQKDLPLDNAYTPTNGGEGVTAFIIDTGVRATHETFGGRVSGGFDAIDGDDNPDDGFGHGTHVAGTIGGTEYGLAKSVAITPVRVLDDTGSGTTEQVVAGIDWVTQNHSGPSVANMSLGGGVDEALDTAVSNSIASGVTYAIAAGNSTADAKDFSPARVPEAITVAASDINDAQAEFSNFGSLVDVYAPGVDITSSWNDSDTGTNTISGTSMATPHVAGAAVLFLSANPDAAPADVATALTGAATPDKITNASPDTANLLLYTGP
jgi:subtilisin family serine protease